MNLIDKHGGYRTLDSFTLARIIELGTWRFCEKFLNRKNDPCGRLFDQMTMSARSGRSNMVEGSERAGTSKGTEMRLTDVARASLAELMGDYEFWLLKRKSPPWLSGLPDAQAVYSMHLDPNPLGDGDGLHEAALYALKQFDKFSKWLESDDPDVVANAMLILLRRVIKMLNRQIAKQGEIFRDEGGFHERMTSVRLEEREKQQVEAGVPECPECGKLMRRRTARSGPNAGTPFWGCTGYPECKGTREVEK